MTICVAKEDANAQKIAGPLEDIQTSDKICSFYTGFPYYGTFKALFDYLKDAAATKRNWRGRETANKSHFSDKFQTKPGPDSKLTLEEEFLIVMMRLKVGLFQKDLAHRFGISEATVSRLFTSWINLMYLERHNMAFNFRQNSTFEFCSYFWHSML